MENIIQVLTFDINIFMLRRTIIYKTKYLFHKISKFGYVQDGKVHLKCHLSTVQAKRL